MTGCGAFTWAITDTSDNAITTPVITAIDVASATKSIDTYTDDITDAGTYNLRVHVSYTDHSSVITTHDFTLVL